MEIPFIKKMVGSPDRPEGDDITNPRGVDGAVGRRSIIDADPLDEVHVYGMTDTGRVRPDNEDFFVLAPDLGLYAVADGMGGHNAGDVASKEVCRVILAELRERSGSVEDDRSHMEGLFWEVIRSANDRVLALARGDPRYRGMGTTLIVAVIHGDRLYLAHVGDARGYRWRQGQLEPLTEDHSVVAGLVRTGDLSREEARVSPLRNEITRAVGIAPAVEPSLTDWDLLQGDRLILCSDGLWDMLPEDRIEGLVGKWSSARELTERLVEEANAAGGEDNITVVTYIHRGQDPDPGRLSADDTSG